VTMLGAPNKQAAITVLALGVLTFLWCLPGIDVRGTKGAHVAVDEPQYLLSATSLWDDLDLDISDELAEERWREYHEAELPEQTKPLDGGRRVSPHDPLLPLVLAVPMGLFGWVGAKVAMAAMAGVLAALLLWTAVVRLRVPTTRAAVTVACFSLSLPLTAYATQVYPELPAALAVTVAIAAVLGDARRTAAVAVVALPWLSVKYAPVATVLALWLLVRHRAHARAIVAWFVVNGLAFAGLHQLIYGGWTPYAAGDHFVGGELTVAGTSPNYGGRARRLLALLVDRDYGLVAWQPAWLLAIPAVASAARRRDPLVLVFAAGWLTATFVALTMHGYWWPGRQVVVVLPVVVLLVAVHLPAIASAAGLVVGGALWWWFVLGDSTFVVHWRSHSWLRPLLVPANDDELLTVWIVIVAILVVLSVRGDQDPRRRERADTDDARAHANGDGAVG